MRTRLLTIVGSGVFLVGTAAGWSPAAPAPSEDLPDGPGRQTTSARCLTCHGVSLIEEQRLSAAGWKREIDKMVGWGATLTEAEVQLLSEYFSRRFGPAATVTQRANASSPLKD